MCACAVLLCVEAAPRIPLLSICLSACVQDPHGELQGQNVLIVRYSAELTAARFGLSAEKAEEVLAVGREKLAQVRKGRPPPHLDTKMLSSWNGERGAGTLYSRKFSGVFYH